MRKKIEVGDTVIVPDPIESDLHSHSFIGSIFNFDKETCIVVDGEGYLYEIETFRLKPVEDEEEQGYEGEDGG